MRALTPIFLISALSLVSAAAVATEHTESLSISDKSRSMVESLAAFRFDELGHPQLQSDSIKPVLAPPERPHRLLVLPVQFSDVVFDRFAGEPDQDDRNRDYLQELLFAGGVAAPEPGTLTHYFRHQSRGAYNITGDIFPVVKLPKTLAYYGEPSQSPDGQWRNDVRSDELIQSAFQAAVEQEPDFPWADYDIWDPDDFDQDGIRDEPDGYIDHAVLVLAGGAQSSCHGLFKMGEKLTVNSPPDAVSRLTEGEKNCVNRIWPHRGTLAANLGKGPVIDGVMNPRAGVDLGNGLWLVDYNAQSEYTSVSTFIHEFGHSIGAPDIYSRTTSNSTGSWEVMSSTIGPEPQNFSAWSQTVFGWMRPCVIRPPQFGGFAEGELYLKVLGDWSGDPANPAVSDACDAAMVILSPKIRKIQLGKLSEQNGKLAAYTGQGNDMLRTLSRTFDLSSLDNGTKVSMSVDLWFEIEAGWDYLYVEAAGEGEEFQRILPTDKTSADDKDSVMPLDKGHEGPGSLPGFSGLSGDRDGDGKVESATGCDPDTERTLAEDRIGDDSVDPCSVAEWVTAEFDLSHYAGSSVTVKFTYFTDGAAVENGALIDNVSVSSIDFSDDFEGDLSKWVNNGFTLSPGHHELATHHFYMLEYRDPYAEFETVKNYDAGLNRKPGFVFYPNGEGGFDAVNNNYRPGVLLWYANGSYLFSQNDPAEFGPGNGFLLVVDSTPQEFKLESIPEQYFKEDDGWTSYQFDESAQDFLKTSFVDVMCWQRTPAFYSTDVAAEDLARCADRGTDKPPMESIHYDGRTLKYGYDIINSYLPGPDRMPYKSGTTLFDLRIRDGKTQYRLYDRILRNWHSGDAPFSLETFDNGMETYGVIDGEMRLKSTQPFAPVSSFSDDRAYISPKLPFGGAKVPTYGFGFELQPIDAEAPVGSVVKVKYRFKPQASVAE